MNDPTPRDRLCGLARPAAWAALGLLWSLSLVGSAGAAPGDGKPPDEARAGVGRLTTATATLLQRPAAGAAWEPVQGKAEVHSRDQLLALPGAIAVVESANSAVRLVLWGNLPELSPLPVFESAVVLHDSPDYDLDVTLERGRIALISNKDKDPARVRVRARTETWVLTLAEKGDVAGMELYGRWPRGVAFNAKGTEGPTQDLSLFVLRGAADLKAGGERFAMRAPPGPAYFHWDSAGGADAGPRRVQKLPSWAEPGARRTTEGRRVGEALALLREHLREQSVEKALGSLRAAADKEGDRAQAATEREVAVFSYGALDDLRGLLGCLTDDKHVPLRENAVEALRHWIGRAPGQDRKVYEFLVKQEKYAPAQADTVVQLLHTPFERGNPETYELLIEDLRSKRLAIRELARWHLYRLAPAGRNIAYDANGSEQERQRAYEQWKKLVPDGKLPPEPKAPGK